MLPSRIDVPTMWCPSNPLTHVVGAMQAHSRMAALLMEVGRPDAAVTALEGLGEVANLSPAERKDQVARLRSAMLAAVGTASKANHYKLMGLPRTCNTDEVRNWTP